MKPPRVIRDAQGKLVRVSPAAIRLDPNVLEVFAWVGVSIAYAQALERTLAAYLTLARPEAATATRPQFRRFLRDANAMTLSVLVSALLKCSLPTKETETLSSLSKVFKRRNYIAHHFFRKPSRRAMLATDAGRSKLVLEAKRDIIDFGFWTRVVTPHVLRHAIRLGDRSDHLKAHADWLQTVRGDLDDLRAEARTAVAIDPSLALQIGQIMEEIEGGRNED
jgi:hypothetical protein